MASLPRRTVASERFWRRFMITGAGTVAATGSNVGATSEAAEPFDIIGAGNGTPSVWWTWKATCSFTVAPSSPFISTSGSSFDTVLGVFTGSSLASLLPFAADDDSGDNLTSRLPNDSTGPRNN